MAADQLLELNLVAEDPIVKPTRDNAPLATPVPKVFAPEGLGVDPDHVVGHAANTGEVTANVLVESGAAL